jgi:dipeptidase E
MKKPDRIIFAIGGGELGDGETLAIDKAIVAAAKKNRRNRRNKVRALVIPTASGDEHEYCQAFEKIYGRRLGCETDILYLYGRNPSKASLKRQIDRCDLVYVGGGSTPAMIRMWRRYDIDKFLRSAWRRGTVMSGLSAGANCWFRYGLSDAYTGRFATVTCLGFIDLACNVHYSSQKGRKQAFDKLVQNKKIAGIALDDNACIKIVNDNYEIIKSDKTANACWVYDDAGKVRQVKIETGRSGARGS